MSAPAAAGGSRAVRIGAPGAATLSYGLALLLGFGLVLYCFPSGFLFPHAGQPWMPVGDMAIHAVGQRYFMQDAWRWPPLAIPALGYPDGTNVAFTDSIPIEALLLKLLAPTLPAGFDGIGLWYALCWLLQPVAAVWCLRGAGERRLLPALAVALAAVSMPAWWNRFGHDALCAQFLLLLALGFYIRLVAAGGWKTWAAAGALNALALLVHPYLCVMTLALLAAVPATLLPRRDRRCIAATGGVAATVAVVFGVALLFGYVGAKGGAGFGMFAMDVLSPVWPAHSFLFGAAQQLHPVGADGMEGYNYLGAGLLFGLATMLALRPAAAGRLVLRNAGLAAALLALTLFAISTHVRLDNRSILDLSYTNGLIEQFRASGRFFWPVAYALLVGTILLAARYRHVTVGAALLVMIAGLQFVDVLGFVHGLRTKLVAPAHFTVDATSLRQDFAAARRITLLPSWFCLPPDQAVEDQEQLLQLLLLASEHPRPVNTVYAARWYHAPRCDDSWHATTPLAPGEVRVLLPAIAPTLLALVPDAARFCRPVGQLTVCAGGTPPPLTFGQMSFTAGGAGIVLLGGGWSHPESWGIWSDGARANLYLRRAKYSTAALRLRLSVVGFAPKGRAAQHVTVLDGARVLARWRLPDRKATVQTLTLPAVATPGLTHLRFVIDKPTSPADRGLAPDDRQLGLGLVSLMATPAAPNPDTAHGR